MGETKPTGNTAELLEQLTHANTDEINLISSAIGAVADIAGAVGAVYGVVSTFLNLFGTSEDPNRALEEILTRLENDFEVMFASLKARQTQEGWGGVAGQVAPATSVVQSLGGYVHANPPLTDDERITHINMCLTPLNMLSDTTAAPVTGAFFLAVYSDQTYWTDPGTNAQASFVEVLAPPSSPDGPETVLWQPAGSIDAGYGTVAPPAPEDDLVFSYLYVLPYYLKAVGMAMSVGGSLFPDFGKNADREQAALLMFSDFLKGIHDKIADEGIQRLVPPDPGDVAWKGDLVGNIVVPGIAMGTSVSGISNVPPEVDRMTFEVGAVERFGVDPVPRTEMDLILKPAQARA